MLLVCEDRLIHCVDKMRPLITLITNVLLCWARDSAPLQKAGKKKQYRMAIRTLSGLNF